MSESNQTKSGNEDYDLSVKQAAKALGKSTRTIHRYIDKGKLSRTCPTELSFNKSDHPAVQGVYR